VPLQAPDRGLLPAFVIALVVVAAGRLIAMAAFRNQRFEKVTQGNAGILVADGVMDTATMIKTRISRERLFSALRGEGIMHLGEVKRLYMEAAGDFTCIREEKPEPGLSVLPRWDKEFYQEQPVNERIVVCCGCGNRQQPGESTCTSCGTAEWSPAAVA
jgi:uncharacterized membrane protein YcaP (DUF421 family)